MTEPKVLAEPGEFMLGFGLRLEFELGLLLIGGVVLIGLFTAVERLSNVIPMTRARRVLVERARPVLSVTLMLLYVLFVLRVALRHGEQVQVAAVLVLALVLIAAGWFAVRDIIAGVVIKAGRLCSVGDYLRVGDIEGRVAEMGLRSVNLETSQGDEAVVPYSVLSQAPLLRTPSMQGPALHVFRLRTPAGVSVSDTRQAVLEGAMCTHWASVVRPPQIKPLGNHEYEVSIFALDADYAPDVEAAVIKATGFSRPSATRAPVTARPIR